MPARTLFNKWNRWLKRIEGELIELVVQQAHFHELQAAIAPYMNQVTGAETARWIAQAYAAYACLAIRRLTEPPNKRPPPKKGDPRLTVSLAILLEDLALNRSQLTRERQRRMYRRHMRALPRRVAVGAADKVFDQVAQSRAHDEVSQSRVNRDIMSLRRAAKRIKRRVDKVYAHIERDRRRIGPALRFAEIDAAIRTLLSIHRRYALLAQGRDTRNIVSADGLTIMSDLKRIWP
jgi:hypothetical protein